MAAGIFLTRIFGLLRERAIATYLGAGFEVDAFRAALRIPNIIRNLLGEGTLSGSFIPVYAGLLETGENERARALARSLASFLVLVGGASALLGVILAPWITAILVPKFSTEAAQLTTTLIRILFPMASLMLLSAWCLGILNTHRKFFLTFAAPTLWNIAQIATLVALGGHMAGAPLTIALAFGALAGGALQFVIQLPSTIRVIRGSTRLELNDRATVLKGWLPVIVGAGVVQLSGLIDIFLAGRLPVGAIAQLGYAQLLALLPVSLFGVSVAAAALPEMSRDAAEQRRAIIWQRAQEGIIRASFFVLPSAVALWLFGDHVINIVLRSGEFGASETTAVAAVLAAFAIGVPARGIQRLVVSGHHAIGDTKTPVIVAIPTLLLSATLAVILMQRYGVAGIALGGSIAVYANVLTVLILLCRALRTSLLRANWWPVAVTILALGIAIPAALGVESLVDSSIGFFGSALLTLGTFGVTYLVVGRLLRHPVVSR